MSSKDFLNLRKDVKSVWLRLMVVVAVLLAMVPVLPARAALSICQTDVSPHDVAPGSDTSFSFGLHNVNDVSLRWVRLSKPVGDTVTFSSASSSGWTATPETDFVAFTDGELTSGGNQGYFVQATASSQTASGLQWVVEVSDNADGSGAITCTGDMSLNIAQPASVVNISDVRVASVGTDRVTVLWNTDVASTSRVEYGLDETYGSMSSLNSSLVTSHSVTLTGLSSNTPYHYRVTSTVPADGGTASSDDNTFLTADQGAVSEGGGTSGGGTVTTPTGQPTESIPPTVEITTKLTGAYKSTPRFEGRASDNDAVAKVEYSIDGGKNWIAVDSMTAATVTTTTGKGKKRKTATTTDAKNVTFAFTPVIVEDGNYVVLARATDPSGNRATSSPQTLVIDQLPPRFGASVVTIGPQMITPAEDGALVLPAGLDYRMSVSLVGGPTKVAIRAQLASEEGQSFSLKRSAEAGLWVGVLSFTKPGQYRLTGEAVDGAGNAGKRVLATVQVVPPVEVTGDVETLKGVEATLFSLNPETHSWRVWDAAPYGQQNPQKLDAKGKVSLLVPAGEYYLKLAVPGAPDTLTSSFTVDQPVPLTGKIALQKPPGFKLGPITVYWPWTQLVNPPLKVAVKADGAAKTNVKLPLVSLPTTAGETVSTVDWYGKPTVLAAVATWAPTTAEQLAALSALSGNEDVNVVVLAMQQRPETVAAYLQVAGSKQVAVADPDGLLSNTLTTPGVPALYFMDRHGIIKKVMVGTRSAEDILSELGRL